jgi:very-short-patch-repair endonuclease
MSDRELIEIDVVPILERGSDHKHDTGFEDVIDSSDDFLQGNLSKITSSVSRRPAVIFEQACQMAAMNAVSQLAYSYSEFLPLCESEIEKIFLAAFIAESQQDGELCLPDGEYWKGDVAGFVRDRIDGFLGNQIDRHGPTPTTMVMQVPIGDYRVDFLLYGISAMCEDKSKWLKVGLIVECDGHDFHEKTKAQATRDKKRDRELTSRGFTVMRFTGSEIWRNPRGCVREAVSYIKKLQWNHHIACLRGE